MMIPSWVVSPNSSATDSGAHGEGRPWANCGVHLGRKPKLTPHQKREALARRDAGKPLAEIARSYGVHHSTISRLQP